MCSTGKENKKVVCDTDAIIDEIGGSLGKFQVFFYLLLTLPFFLAGEYSLNYVFSALNLDYRCQIPECESSQPGDFYPPWLPNAVPHKDLMPLSCYRYDIIRDLTTDDQPVEFCDAQILFNQSAVVKCDNFIYRTDELSILNAFNLTCDDEWKLSMVGTVQNMARFIGIPILGHFSDKFGRKPVLILCALISCAMFFIRSFVNTFNWFLVLEILDSFVNGSVYSGAFTLAMESGTVKSRVLITNLLSMFFPTGQIFIGLITSYTHNYQWMFRIISLTSLLMISYIYLLPESLRWLLVQKRYDESIKMVKQMAETNGKSISQETLDTISACCRSTADTSETQAENKWSQLKVIATKPIFLFRLSICILLWITCAFVSYGLSVASVLLPGDKYTNFIIVAMSQLPAYPMVYFLLTYMGRRWTIFWTLIISGIAILLAIFIDNQTLALVLFFVSKGLVQAAFGSVYIYTGELWPTKYRQTIAGLCSMMGRLGAIVSPLTPLIAEINVALPQILFCSFAIMAGISVLFLPETFDKKLPDTFDDLDESSDSKNIS